VRGANSPLPVSLFTFSGYKEGNHNLLKWSTASEQNNKGFEIERSTDGVNYSSVGFVPSQSISGNSNSKLNYSFIDNSPQGDKQYYRLRQIDFNNNEKLSNIILIKGTQPKEFTLDAVFPNPAKTLLNVFVNSPKHENILLQAIDINGRVLQQKSITVDTGFNTVSFDVSSLSNGVYLLKVMSSAGETKVSRFIKQ
jgi:hypothetical protein